MKYLGSVLAVASLVVGSASLSADAQTPNLTRQDYVASYVTNFYVTSITQVSGSNCSFTLDEKSDAQLLVTDSGRSVTFVGANPYDSTGIAISYFLFLPPLPTGINTGSPTAWNGTYKKWSLPGGTESGALSFSGTIQATGRLSFVGSWTFSDLPAPDSSSCTVGMQFSSVFSGIALNINQ
jgi:hypothetical protein